VISLLILSCGFLGTEVDTPAASNDRQVRLVYTTAVHGEIEPCG
jgi:hypothetical protein